MEQLIHGVVAGDFKSVARALTWVENEGPSYESLLKAIPATHEVPVIGFTGPPGAGKSTLINAVTGLMLREGKKVAIVAVDPTSPFNFGSLLADRVRMSDRFTDEGVFIRSVATRGSLGGLSDKILEITDVLKAAPFDVILVETVGVGQSEVEIAGLADVTVLVLVPEGGDDIQAMKAGIMEIADIYVVNKSDREGADRMASSLEKMATLAEGRAARPVIKTSTIKPEGLEQLAKLLLDPDTRKGQDEKRIFLLAEKVYRIIQKRCMKNVDKAAIANTIRRLLSNREAVNVYALAEGIAPAPAP